MVKPDWKDAPEWAKFLAMDECGMWFWYEDKPFPVRTSWWGTGRLRSANGADPEWRGTLEERPE